MSTIHAPAKLVNFWVYIVAPLHKPILVRMRAFDAANGKELGALISRANALGRRVLTLPADFKVLVDSMRFSGNSSNIALVAQTGQPATQPASDERTQLQR